MRYTKQQTEEEKEAMGKHKQVEVAEVRERASVSRERRLALALRAVMDAVIDGEVSDAGVVDAVRDAVEVLDSLGYNALVGIPKQIATLEAQLATALGARDYAGASKITAQLGRISGVKGAGVSEEGA